MLRKNYNKRKAFIELIAGGEIKMKEQAKKIVEELKGKTIHVTAYGHADYSWVHTRQWHINRYVTMIKELIDILDNEDEYKYNIDCYCTFLEPVLQRYPEYAQSLKKYIDSGRIAICGTYSNLRPNLIDGEAFIRNMVLGRKKFKEWFPDSEIIVYADTCDVAASHSQLPQLIKNGGYRFLGIGRPGDLLTLKGIPHDFIYKGIDGTPVVVSLINYGGFWNKETVQKLFNEDINESIVELYETELKVHFSKYSSDILLKGNGCDDGIPLQGYYPFGRLPLAEQFRKYRQAGINIKFSTYNDYYKELELPENKEKLKVIETNYDIADVSFNFCLGGEKSLQNKRIRGSASIVGAEKFDAIESLMGLCKSESLQPVFEKLWQENLFCSAHASQWAFDDDYENLTLRANRVIDRTKEIRTSIYENITKNQKFHESTIAVVFNHHDKPMKQTLRIPVTTPDPAKLELVDGYGMPLSFTPVHPFIFQFLENSVSEWDMVVSLDVPAHGYNSIIATKGSLDTVEKMIWDEHMRLPRTHVKFPSDDKILVENEVISLTMQNGKINGITDKRNNSSTHKPDYESFNEISFNEYSEEVIGFPVFNTKEIHKVEWESCDMVSDKNHYTCLVLNGQVNGHKVKQTITLHSDIASINIKTELDVRDDSYGYMLLSIPCENVKTIYGGIPFGIEPRRVDLEPYLNKQAEKSWDDVGCLHRTIDGMFVAKDFITLRSGDIQLSLVNQTGDRHFKYSKDNKSVGHIMNATSKIQGEMFGNVNKTAFGSYGKHTFNHVISIFPSDESLCEIQQNAEGLCLPVEYVLPLGGLNQNALPAAMSFLSIDDKNIRISAFYSENDYYIVRLWEASKLKTSSKLNLPVNVTCVEKIDFNGNTLEGNSVSLIDGTVYFTIESCEILTFRIKTEPVRK